jgi:hypothetical protein
MKYLFTALLTIVSITSFSQEKAKQKPTVVAASGKDDNCMLSAVYDLPLEINSHQKNKASITHKTTDFVQFNEDGTFEQSINGVSSQGFWSYNAKNNTITVNCNGNQTWVLTAAPNGGYLLTKGEESMQVKKK